MTQKLAFEEGLSRAILKLEDEEQELRTVIARSGLHSPRALQAKYALYRISLVRLNLQEDLNERHRSSDRSGGA